MSGGKVWDVLVYIISKQELLDHFIGLEGDGRRELNCATHIKKQSGFNFLFLWLFV